MLLMGRGFKFAVIVIVIVAASLAPRSRAGQVIDGIVATVNGTAILQSDVEEAARCEALLESRAPGEIGPAQEHAVLERLIDQELLRQQMANGFPPPKAEELAQRIMDLRRQMARKRWPSGSPCKCRWLPLWTCTCKAGCKSTGPA